MDITVLKTITIEAFHQALNEFFSGSIHVNRDIIKDIERLRKDLTWTRIDNLEEMNDLAVYDEIEVDLAGDVSILTDASYLNRCGVFVVEGGYMRGFIGNYIDHFKEALFNGDTFFLTSEKLIVLTHDGVFAIIDKVNSA